jgi:ADP-heptose:LPS heptosyltransferase
MFRPGEEPKRKVSINCLITDGGMGDLLCHLVTVSYLVKKVKHVDPYIWVPDYLLEFAKNVLPKEAKIYNYTTAIKKYNNKMIGISTRWAGQHTAMRCHPIDYSNHVLLDTDLPIEQKNYLKFNSEEIDLSKFNLPENYVIMSVGSTAKTKELSPELLNQLADYIIEKGYTPVFIGKSEMNPGSGPKMLAKLAEVDYTKGIDLTNKTTLTEAAAIISKAKAFVGMEGGMTHLAGFTDVKIVAGYGFVDPTRMMPIRNNLQGYNVFPLVPESTLACRYCQTNMALLYDHDFKNCYYDDYTCIKQLTFDKWKVQIDKCLL